MSSRAQITRLCVFIVVIASGPLVGAKLFDLLVLVGAWSASPPESLRFLPYGDAWPVDTGDFFIPGSAATLLASLLATIAGWRTPWSYRILLVSPLLIIVATLVLTVTVFWPLNSSLWHASQGTPGAVQDASEIVAMVRMWVSLDWVRVALASISFLASVRALSLPYPAENASKDPAAIRILVIVAALSILAFAAYFLIRGLTPGGL